MLLHRRDGFSFGFVALCCFTISYRECIFEGGLDTHVLTVLHCILLFYPPFLLVHHFFSLDFTISFSPVILVMKTILYLTSNYFNVFLLFCSTPSWKEMEARQLKKGVEALMWVDVKSPESSWKAQYLVHFKIATDFIFESEQWWLHWAETQRKVFWSNGEGDLHNAGWPGKNIRVLTWSRAVQCDSML